MKKSKLFLALGGVVLAVGSFVVTRANSARFLITNCHFNGISATLNASGHLTITKAGARTLYLATGSTPTKHTAVTASAGTTQVYYK